MSANNNIDALSGQEGQVGSHVPRDGPITTKGHAPGKLVGNDAVPTFHAQTLPAGSAPASNTFQPNATSETPGQADNASSLADPSQDKESTFTSAEDTLGGATSADVHTGLGHPGQGQTSSELRDGSKAGGGLAGRGAGNVDRGVGQVDEREDPKQRGLERETGDLAGRKEGSGANKGGAADAEL